MNIKNIIILGSAGLIGQELQKILLKKKSYNLFCLDKKSNQINLRKFLSSKVMYLMKILLKNYQRK